MTAADAKPVAGPLHNNSQVMQMTSGLDLYQSQQLQLPVSCLPASVQQLTFEDGQFYEEEEDDDDGGDDDDGASGGDDGTQAHGAGSQLMNVNSSPISRARQNLTSSYASTTVRQCCNFVLYLCLCCMIFKHANSPTLAR